MKIVKLKAWNIQKIKDIEIEPDGSMVVIAGRNRQGKSSLLNCVKFLFEGKNAIGDKALREGADKGGIVATLDNGLIVKRAFTGKDSYLTIEAQDGAKYKSAQSMLDAMRPAFLDPTALARQSPAKQLETLRGLVGLDVSDLDAKRKVAYEERTAVGGAMRQHNAEIADKVPYEIPAGVAPVGELTMELDRRRSVNEEANATMRRQKDRVTLVGNLTGELTAARKKVKELEASLKAELKTTTEMALKVLEIKREDEQEIRDLLTASEENASKAAHNKALIEGKAKAEASLIEYDGLTQTIDVIDAERGQRMKDVQWPIDGLAIADNGITYNGLPFPDNASTSEETVVWTAISMGLNPKLKVLLIHHGNDLDAESRKRMFDMTSAAGYQVWLEVCDENDSDAQVVIEDGQVKDVE